MGLASTYSAANVGELRPQPRNARTLEHALNETVLVSENGASQRITRREAFFKTLVVRALKEPRYAVLLMKFMEQYDLAKEEQIPGCIRIRFVDPDGRERDIDDQRLKKT